MKKYLYIGVALLILAGAGLWASKALADSLGPNLPTSAVDALNGDGWANPTNVENDNAAFAQGNSQSSGNSVSGDLKTTGYGFSIPAGSTINGVVLTIKRKPDISTQHIGDLTVKLIKGGVISGSNKAVAGDWPSTTTTVTYGSSVDLWGLALTASDVNSSDFGADLNIAQTGAGSAQGDVFFLKLTVTYTPSAGGPTQSATSMMMGSAF